MSTVPLARRLASAEAVAPTKRAQRVGFPTFAFIAVSVFMAVGAFNGQNNLLLWLFAATVATLVVGGVLSGFGMMGVRASVSAPRGAAVGQVVALSVRVENRGLFPVFALLVEADSEGVEIGPGSIGRLGRGESVDVRLPAVATERGRVEIRRLRVSSAFPLGVVRKHLRFDVGAPMLVRPARMRIRAEALETSSARGGHGYARSARMGRGEEFFGLREYVPGDPLRTVAWKRSGGASGVLVRQHAQPGSRRVWIELDLGKQASPNARKAGRRHDKSLQSWQDAVLGDPDECGVAVAAALCQRLSDAGRPFGLVLRGGGVLVTAGGGGVQVDTALNALASVGGDQPRRSSWIGGQRDEVLRVGPGARGRNAFDSADPSSFFESWEAGPA